MNRTFIVAELSANHNQDISLAKDSIRAMSESGADAVKVQTYTPDTITIDCDNEYFRIKQDTIWDGMTFYRLYQKTYTPWEWHGELQAYARSLGLEFFSTPFDTTAVDFLETLDVPLYKIASFEITDTPLIEYVAAKRKPIIISTGIATLADIEEAVSTCRRVGNNQITLLQCTSSYPAPIEEANLLTMKNLRETFGVRVGLSDHTLGDETAIAAVALGADVIEKHFILNRELGGPDSTFSMNPEEFKRMVQRIRNVERALGKVTYEMTERKARSRELARSLFFVKDIQEGEEIRVDSIRSIRPGYGLHPRFAKDAIGMRAARRIERGTPVTWECFKTRLE